MERREGSRTPNSMLVLERGAEGTTTLVGPSSRPPSGRRSRNRTPIQRSGSQLEVLPPNDDKRSGRGSPQGASRTSSRPSSRSGSADKPDDSSPRQTHSAGSAGQRSSQGQEGINRTNSLDGLRSPTEGGSRPGSTIHKQVSLTTVKRIHDAHGISNNAAPLTPPLMNGTSHEHEHNDIAQGASGRNQDEIGGVSGSSMLRGNGDGVNVVSEEERTEQRLNYLMEQLSVKNQEIKQLEERKTKSATKRKASTGHSKDKSQLLTDSYYVSTVSKAEVTTESTLKGAAAAPPFLEDKKDEQQRGQTDNENSNNDDEEEEEEEEDEEEPAAPIELMGEFLDAVMEEDYETADKLCKMILIYEPENAECLQFQPLIEEMLKKEWHHQLWGSGSSEEGSDEEGEDEDDEDDDDDDDDDDEDSDEEDSSDSDSSEESDDEEEKEAGVPGKAQGNEVIYNNETES